MVNIGIATLTILILNTISIILLVKHNKCEEEHIGRLNLRGFSQEDEIRKIRRLIEGEKYKIPKAYYIMSDYTEPRKDAPRAELICRELRVHLDASDWNRFQMQPFYHDMINYLDKVQCEEKAGEKRECQH